MENNHARSAATVLPPTVDADPLDSDPNVSSKESAAVLRKVLVGSFVGNFVEWFDYGVYGYLAAFIAVAFFPETSVTGGLILAYGVFAISFIVRPIGSLIWGRYGDKIGRRGALSLSILIMSAATFVIAFIPPYAVIGAAAPILLFCCRIVQGFSASGEYAGASTFIAEYAPTSRRGLYASFVPAGTACGLLFGSLLAYVMTLTLSTDFMNTWGWRIPFLLALPLGYIGRFIRLRLEDTPLYREEMAKHNVTTTPIRDLFRGYTKPMIINFVVSVIEVFGFYLVLSYMPTYLFTEVGVSTADAFLVTTISLTAYLFFNFVMGAFSDRWGRKTILISASVLFAVLSVPIYWLIHHASLVGITGLLIVLVGFVALTAGPLPAFLCELFPTTVRYSGFAFPFNLCNAAFGGTAALIAIWLISVTDNALMPAWVLVVSALVSLIGLLMVGETNRISLREVETSDV